MINKFPFQVQNKIMNIDWTKFKLVTANLKEGVDYELVIREKPRWDTDQMRKYFHGPVLKFIQEQFKVLGYVYGKNEIKEFLKKSFGDKRGSTINRKTMFFDKSTSEYDFETYTKFLNDINAWCIECFQCELPLAEEVE
jgi:hypothetical protein